MFVRVFQSCGVRSLSRSMTAPARSGHGPRKVHPQAISAEGGLEHPAGIDALVTKEHHFVLEQQHRYLSTGLRVQGVTQITAFGLRDDGRLQGSGAALYFLGKEGKCPLQSSAGACDPGEREIGIQATSSLRRGAALRLAGTSRPRLSRRVRPGYSVRNRPRC